MNVFDVKDILDKLKLSPAKMKWIIAFLIVMIPLTIYFTNKWNTLSTDYSDLKTTNEKNVKMIKKTNRRFDSVITVMNKNYYIQLKNLEKETNNKLTTLIDNFDAKMSSNNKTLLKTAIINIGNALDDMLNESRVNVLTPTNSYNVVEKKIFDVDSMSKNISKKDTIL